MICDGERGGEAGALYADEVDEVFRSLQAARDEELLLKWYTAVQN